MLYYYILNWGKQSFFIKRIEKIFLFKGGGAFYFCNRRRKKYMSNFYNFKKPYSLYKFFKPTTMNLSQHTKKRIFIKKVRYSFFRNFFYSIFHEKFTRVVIGMKPYSYLHLNLFFFKNIVNTYYFLFDLNYQLFVKNKLNLVYTINNIKGNHMWSNIEVNDKISFYWNILFLKKVKLKVFKKKNFFNKSLVFKIIFDYRQNNGFVLDYKYNFFSINSNNFNTFTNFNWRFVN